jgi:Cu(I)/Ag(I) efflux system periplasmic protein CusF
MGNLMRRIVTISLIAAIGASPLVRAAADDHSHAQSGQFAGSASRYADGEVRNINKDTGRITLRHGPIANLEMPAMTMVFRVNDPAMLNGVKVGDKVQFSADKVNGALTVIEMKPARRER